MASFAPKLPFMAYQAHLLAGNCLIRLEPKLCGRPVNEHGLLGANLSAY